MSQRCAEKCRFKISFALFAAWVLLLSACTMEELERFAREKEEVNPLPTSSTGIVPSAGALVPHSIIKGGKHEFKGAVGTVARLLVGPADEVKFVKPVAVGGRDNFLYIVDAGAKVVFRYNLDTHNISAIGQVGVRFAGDLGNIYVLKDYSFYIVDSTGKQVLHFDKEGQLLNTLNDPANLSRPMDVWVNERNGDVYVADGSYSHIIVFDRFGRAYKLVGQRGTGPGRFRAITDMTAGVDGLYVVDRLELPIQVFGFEGNFLFSFGEKKQIYPTAIAVDQWKRVYVSDKSDNTIRVYDNKELIAEVGGGGAAPGRFRLITGMWLKDRFLYVADSMNKRVQVMQINPEYSGNFIPLGL
ncbi:MAG: hypothetical protein OEZ68_08455 [Gammaproteobacteria bacterium]|nr:hypothetical protein [Gammaproteobacteria bacterium]MDH5800819.1 hypothetical protein [Gammaproteobacteria bacterium]